MKKVFRFFSFCAIFLASFNNVYAAETFVRALTITSAEGELVIPPKKVWKISALGPQICFEHCVGTADFYIDGSYRLGEQKIKKGVVEIVVEQLHDKPLWLLSGTKITVGDSRGSAVVEEYRSFEEIDDEAPQQVAPQQVAIKPALPVFVAYRQALMGNGLVAQFTNQSNRFLAIVVTATNPSLHQKQVFRLDIPPNETKEIGHLEGWAFSSGDTILVSHFDYAPSKIIIP